MSDTVIRRQYVYAPDGRKLVHPETSAGAIPDLYTALEAFYEERVGAVIPVETLAELETMGKLPFRLYYAEGGLYLWDGGSLIHLNKCKWCCCDGGDTGPDFTAVATYVFPKGYPTDLTIDLWTTEGLELYRAEDDKLIGTVPNLIAEPAQNRVTTDNYYEFTQTVTFALENTDESFPFPDGASFTKEITWRVPREGKTYWQYDGPAPPSNFYSVNHLDFVHIMGELLPKPSIRCIRMIDTQDVPISVAGSISYESFGRQYQVQVANVILSFKPDELDENTAIAPFIIH